MILELHLLQSFPVSNLNRDDLGQPKSATFGGVQRARISSQAQKRAARQKFTEHGLASTAYGARTKRLASKSAAELGDRGYPEEIAHDVVTAALRGFGFGVEKTKLTKYLLYVGHDATTALADYCASNWDTLIKSIEAAKTETQKEAKKKGKKLSETEDYSIKVPKSNDMKKGSAEYREAEKILDAARTADIALFGRMIADNSDFNVDAASQVAHALSTHAVTTEFDYYTALDDFKPDDAPGADMIGTVDFNTACYYRYANLDLDQLRENLPGDEELVAQAAKAWFQAFIHATPTGKQTTTAARTKPETLLGTVRTSGAWNLANAFLRPVAGTDLLGASTERLFSHFESLRGFYGSSELQTVAGAALSCNSEPLPDADTVTNLDEFTSRLLNTALEAA